MKYCSHCGAVVSGNNQFCRACGHELPAEKYSRQAPETGRAGKKAAKKGIVQKPRTAQNAKKGKKKAVWIIAASLVLVLAIGAAAVWFLFLRNTTPEAGTMERYDAAVQLEKQTKIADRIGDCGENTRWQINLDTGKLQISGDGKVTQAPWSEYAQQIQTLIVKEGVTGIGAHIFRDCTALTKVELPKTVNTIESAAFRGCDALESFVVHEENSAFAAQDGVLLSKDGTVLIQVPAAHERTGYTVPSTVTTIESGAFYRCKNLTSVIIPEGVTELKEQTFYGCSAMTQISLPKSLTIIQASALSKNEGSEECMALENVYYAGTQKQWDNISILGDNENLMSATCHTQSTGGTGGSRGGASYAGPAADGGEYVVVPGRDGGVRVVHIRP